VSAGVNNFKTVGLISPPARDHPEFHAFAFNYASAFVHPSAVFIIRHMSQAEPDGLIEISAKSQDEEAEYALRISHCLILNTISLRLKYSPSTALLEHLDECKKDFLKIWGYPAPI